VGLNQMVENWATLQAFVNTLMNFRIPDEELSISLTKYLDHEIDYLVNF
jgi:hypothetical protein